MNNTIHNHLNRWITQSEYNKKHKQFKERQYNISIQLDDHTKADESYDLTAKTVLSLAQRALEIFESSEPEEKQQLLSFLLQNPVVKERKLLFSLNSPFDVISNYNRSSLLRLLSDVRTYCAT